MVLLRKLNGCEWVLVEKGGNDMEISILHPVLIFGLSIALAAIWSKTLFLSIPIFVVGLHFYYPRSTVLQIACGILWILLVVGNAGVVAYSNMFHRVPKTLKLLTVLLGVSATGTFLFIRYKEQVNKSDIQKTYMFY